MSVKVDEKQVSEIVDQAGKELNNLSQQVESSKITCWEALKKAYQMGIATAQEVYKEARR